MEGYANLNEEICEIRNSTMLNQYELDCRDFNNDMSQRCLNLRSSLINWQVDMNKTWNRQICNQFDEMATKLGEIPGINVVVFFMLFLIFEIQKVSVLYTNSFLLYYSRSNTRISPTPKIFENFSHGDNASSQSKNWCGCGKSAFLTGLYIVAN